MDTEGTVTVYKPSIFPNKYILHHFDNRYKEYQLNLIFRQPRRGCGRLDLCYWTKMLPNFSSLYHILHEIPTLFQFMGYDVGNNMIHVGGTVTTMFPADGGQIRVNKTEFVQGEAV